MTPTVSLTSLSGVSRCQVMVLLWAQLLHSSFARLNSDMSASPHTVTATGNVVVVSQVRHNVAPVFPPPPPPPGTRPVNPADNTSNFRKQQPVIGVRHKTRFIQSENSGTKLWHSLNQIRVQFHFLLFTDSNGFVDLWSVTEVKYPSTSSVCVCRWCRSLLLCWPSCLGSSSSEGNVRINWRLTVAHSSGDHWRWATEPVRLKHNLWSLGSVSAL